MAQKGISVDFYDGAYGPTILIRIENKNDLVKIADFIRAIDTATENEFPITDIIQPCSINSLDLFIIRRLPAHKASRKSLSIVDGKAYWENSSEGWQLCAELLDGLLKSSDPGHQYLIEEGADDALIEISYKEGLLNRG